MGAGSARRTLAQLGVVVPLIVAGPVSAQECTTYAWGYVHYAYDPVADRVREGTPVTHRYETGEAARDAYELARERERGQLRHWEEAARRTARQDVPDHERRLSRGWRDASSRQLGSYRAPHCAAWSSAPATAGPAVGPEEFVGPPHPSELDPYTREGARQVQDLLELNEVGKDLLAIHPYLEILDPLAKGLLQPGEAVTALRDTEKAFRGYDWEQFQQGLRALNQGTLLALSSVFANQCSNHRRKGNDVDLRYWQEVASSFEFPGEIRRASMLEQSCGPANGRRCEAGAEDRAETERIHQECLDGCGAQRQAGLTCSCASCQELHDLLYGGGSGDCR